MEFYFEIIMSNAPFWSDVVLLISLWLGAIVNGYLGLMRVTHSHGPYVVARVVVAAGMLILAMQLTWTAEMYSDLGISWWMTIGLLCICGGSVALGIERLKNGMGSKE